MFSNLKERLNSAVLTLAENERLRVARASRGRLQRASSDASSHTSIYKEEDRVIQELEEEFCSKDAENGEIKESDKKSENNDSAGDQEETEKAVELPKEVTAKLEKLKRYEQKFPDIIKGYKRVLAEKRDFERTLKENTPLEGISDVDAFEAHIKSLVTRSEVATFELINRWLVMK